MKTGLTLAALVATALLAWWSTSGPTRSGTQFDRLLPSTPPATPGAGEDPPEAPPQLDSRSDVSEIGHAPAQPDEPVATPERAAVEKQTESVHAFELQNEVAVLSSALKQRHNELAQAWFASGRYEEQLGEIGQRMSLTGRKSGERAAPGEVVVASSRVSFDGSGKPVVQVVKIPPGHDAELDELRGAVYAATVRLHEAQQQRD